jgi:hypothetical protein
VVEQCPSAGRPNSLDPESTASSIPSLLLLHFFFRESSSKMYDGGLSVSPEMKEILAQPGYIVSANFGPGQKLRDLYRKGIEFSRLAVKFQTEFL